MRRGLCALLLSALAGSAAADCGELVELAAHAGQTQRYALARPAGPADVALLLLAGGSGRLALDARGCPTALTGNSLVRMRSLFLGHGFATA